MRATDGRPYISIFVWDYVKIDFRVPNEFFLAFLRHIMYNNFQKQREIYPKNFYKEKDLYGSIF